ncbi:SAM-dependent methyltransferase [Campylobacter fetus subsp. testudinum]|uniref:N-6 DNA methylase n=1 Tax=Campylobacter fetus TaxID=196 RepID=UPI000818A952|nr:N-6 DNA methylase [Campylobacter fetus]OCR89254.1 SAM-dependent methyltransferase [Campylobacter fetus subsp. testudinum]OCS04435.1 SAM-dependent methyltransferase [Campylobacter fetus subsp. testudinum]
MITKDNLKQVLQNLNFKQNGEIYTKTYANNAEIKVDFKNEKIIYPAELKKGDETTCNFLHPENFVVLECVNRLLEKGYKAINLELEPRWQLGRDAKSGKADILVKDENALPYLIIECKTAGSEFSKEWNKMQNEPSQLISYHQQERSAKFLALYTSNFDGQKIKFENYILNFNDNESYLQSQGYAKSYQMATSAQEIFEVWSEIYKGDYSQVGIFEKNINPYEVGKNALCFDDLKELTSEAENGKTHEDAKYHEFATILRKYNISGKENAFDKLVNLFLCKIYDETHNKENLQFCYRGVTADSFEAMQERLMKLYKDAMREYLDEEITYVSDEQIEMQFSDFKRNKIKTEALKKQINEFIRMLKFYSHSDFSFLEVHNKTLFEQNAQVLKAVIKLFENLKLTQNKTSEALFCKAKNVSLKTNQLLGNLFELFLQKGMKQDEGQFFTPIQICEFIIYSLPLEMLFKNKIPKVIDYACGAGHFLNTYANIAKIFCEDLKSLNENIYGIEKEYRLSKVAKVSAAMYGQNGVKIAYADGLDESKFKERDFDLLVANPPYSVKGFLQTLSKNECEKYELFKDINIDNSNAIECFFIERANQLLKSYAKAAIILPSSILNKDGIYEKTREIILRNFDIISIAELGSNTFGATGTNTVILFLSKKQTYQNESNSQKYINLKENLDGSLSFENFYLTENLQKYCEFIGYKKDEFSEFLSGGGYGEIYSHEIFKEYLNEFKNSSALSNLVKSKRYKDSDEKEVLKQKEFFNFCLNLEKEKILFFSLIKDTNTLIIKSPSENRAQSKFLGYEWSNRKGSEGLKELNQPYLSPLFERENLDNENKLCFLVRTAFILNDEFEKQKEKDPYASFSKNLQIPQSLSEFAFSVSLLNCIDFKSAKFNKAINLNAQNSKNGINLNPFENSKFELVKLGSILESLGKGKRPASFENQNGKIPFFKSSFEIFACDEADFNTEALIIGDGGTANIHYHNGEFSASDHAYIFTNSNSNLKFTFFTIKSNLEILQNGFKGIGLQNIAKSYILGIKIPIPPLEIQAKIVQECEEVESKIANLNSEILEFKNLIKAILFKSKITTENISIQNELLNDLPTPQNYGLSEWESVKLTNKDFILKIGKRVLDKDLTQDGINVFSANVKEPFGKIDKDLIKDFSLDSVLWGIDGDWMTGFVKANEPFYPTDHCGVLRSKSHKAKILEFALFEVGAKFGFSRQNRASIERISNLTLSLPPLEAQEKIVKAIEFCEGEISNLNNELKTLENATSKILKRELF